MANRLPRVGITMGDAAGIGPEITLKSLAQPDIYDVCNPVVLGDARVIQAAAETIGTPFDIRSIDTEEMPEAKPGLVNVIDYKNVDPSTYEMGVVKAGNGDAAVHYTKEAGRMCLDGRLQAMTSAPLNKEAMQLGGYDYIGHTEILADLTGSPRCTTMLITGSLRVVHVTRHLPLRQVADAITRERVLETIRLTAESLPAMGIVEPRLGVAALNPHGGEGGLLGREEIEEIAPAVEAAQAMGIDAGGPYPADSIFFRAIAGEFDAVVAMYHDQGHIPVKTHGFESSVTVTLGLPIVRTSVDHGTAFDIAWQGLASPQSLIEAIKLAAEMASTRIGI